MEHIVTNVMSRLRPTPRNGTNPEWSHHLHNGRDKKRFQCCLNSDGFIHYMRATQGRSGGDKVDPSLLG